MTRRNWLGAAAAGALSQAETLRLPRKVRLAIIGFEGHTGELLDPLPQLPDVELVAVAGGDAREVRRFPATRRYDDYRRMLDREQLDMVGVCNNNGERAAAILACAERKLHVAAEKPLAIELADLSRIREAVGRYGIRLTMLLPMRFSPPYLALKKLVESGAVGEVAQIGAQKSYKLGEREPWYLRRSTYGGTIPWVGIHMIDLMRWSSGREFREAAAFQSRVGFPQIGEMENVAATLFRLDNGGVATLCMDFLRPETAPSHGDDRLRLAGTAGVAEYLESTGVTLLSAKRKPEVIHELPQGRSLFVDFLASVYLGRPVGLDLPDIFRVNEIVLRAREAAERHRLVQL